MKSRTTLVRAMAGAAVVAVAAVFTPGCTCGPGAAAKPAKIEAIDYHGWTNALRLTSAQAEVIVVPEVGRVMSFRLLSGYFKFATQPWPQLERQRNYIAITRDTQAPHKMGTDAQGLLWVGENEACAVRTWTQGKEYPDGGASAEVYTNPDPKKYVELEMLGPLSLMKPGDATSLTESYSLHEQVRRTPPLQTEDEFAWFFR